MDIEKYRVDKSVYDLRDSIKSKCDILDGMSSKIDAYIKPKVNEKVNELKVSFENFFVENGFEIRKDSFDNIFATNPKAEFELNLLSSDKSGVNFKLINRKENIYKDIFIRGTALSTKMMRYKSDPGLTMFKIDEFKVRNDINLKKLEDMDKAVDENILWFEETLKELDKLEFIFCSNTGKEYKDFNDFFKKI